MTMELFPTIAIIIIFVLVEAFFSGCEIAMISVNRVRAKQKADAGDPQAQNLINLLNNPEILFATTSLGTNLAVVTSTAVFTSYMVFTFGEIGDWLAMLIIAPIILFAGEIVPKIIFQNRADTLSPILAAPLIFFSKVFSPIISWTCKATRSVSRGVLGKDAENGKTYSRDQIREILSLDSQTIHLGPTERKMIHRIFNFGDITVEQCMTPLVQIDAVHDSITLQELHQVAIDSGYSRLPVFHQNMHNIIGLLNIFDLLDSPIDSSPITPLVRPVHYVPQNKKIDDLLKELQTRGLHMAIVVDEYGGCIGLATVEDLLEEILGEIEDEFDKPEKQYENYSDGDYLIEAGMEISAINDTLHLDLPIDENYETLGGLIIHHLEKIPTAGQQITVDGYRLTVKEANKRRVISVIVRPLTDEEEEDAEDEEEH
jgi:putative hemolysin